MALEWVCKSGKEQTVGAFFIASLFSRSHMMHLFGSFFLSVSFSFTLTLPCPTFRPDHDALDLSLADLLARLRSKLLGPTKSIHAVSRIKGNVSKTMVSIHRR